MSREKHEEDREEIPFQFPMEYVYIPEEDEGDDEEHE